MQIYNLEGSYLTDTAAHSGGNILHGFEGYLKNPTGGRKKFEIGDADRMFSNSSTTYKKVRSASAMGGSQLISLPSSLLSCRATARSQAQTTTPECRHLV